MENTPIMVKSTNEQINKAIIEEIIAREIDKRNPDRATNRPNDKGGRTQYGIAERSNPKAWLDGKVTLEEAIVIYRRKYLEAPGFGQIEDPRLRAQLVDYGVNSGPGVAIQKLQLLLKVEQDGVLGPKTLLAANSADPVLLGNKLALERVRMIGRIVNKSPAQAENINGWLDRALEFMRL